ncbi:MAG: hypothetical protein LBN33_03385 [Desulfovibrio sp.]|jgi:hypothetical protein|nr:hypothetical protein [Desulfovibrio sp.]
MNTIRIIDGHYNEKFTVPDGGMISIDGKRYRCRYLNGMNFELIGLDFNSRDIYHISQFGRDIIDRGRDVKRVED